MDFILADEHAMDLMAKEFARLGASGKVRAMASAFESASQPRYICDADSPVAKDELISFADAPQAGGFSAFSFNVKEKAVALYLLYLYFARSLGYNNGYGTQIYDSPRGVGGLRSYNSAFRACNGIL